MSQIATFNLIDSSKLSELSKNADIIITKKFLRKKTVDNYWTYLNENSTSLYGLNPEDLNGGIFLNIILYLKYKKGLDFEQGTYSKISSEITQKRDVTTFILTKDHQEKFNSIVDTENISFEECQYINKEYDEDESEESANDVKEALKALQQILSKISDEKAVVFSIG